MTRLWLKYAHKGIGFWVIFIFVLFLRQSFTVFVALTVLDLAL